MGTFLCGPEALGEVLAKKCAKYSDVDPRKTKFYFNKENFWEPHPTGKTGPWKRFAVLDSDKTSPVTAVTVPVDLTKITRSVLLLQSSRLALKTRLSYTQSLEFTVIWNYYPYLVLSICLSEDKAGRCVWDDVTFLHSSWGTNSIKSNYVSPVCCHMI